MFGMLTPLTMIPDYKLKMNVLNLQHHWSPLLTEELAKEDIVIDLADLEFPVDLEGFIEIHPNLVRPDSLIKRFRVMWGPVLVGLFVILGFFAVSKRLKIFFVNLGFFTKYIANFWKTVPLYVSKIQNYV